MRTNTGVEEAKEEKLPEAGGDKQEAGDDAEAWGGVGGGVAKLSQKDGDNVDHHKQKQVKILITTNRNRRQCWLPQTETGD